MTEFLNALLEQFNGPVSVQMILLSLASSFVCALLIDLIYRKTYSGVAYSRGISLSLYLLAMVTAMIIRTINSNLSLSLGMVGALSIVRFRTAVKDPVDTAFMFWAITGGIMSGAGLYLLAVCATVALGLIYYLLNFYQKGRPGEYLLVVRYDSASEQMVQEAVRDMKKQVRSKSMSEGGVTELTCRVPYDAKMDERMAALQKIEGVKSVSLVSYSNDYGL